MIDRITLENFKSFYGKQKIGPLHKCFTAIVGPNGSGKSNLIESLLFVFGKKAKQMRFDRLQQLIHSSGKHQNLEKASVKIKFHDIYDDYAMKNTYIIVPGSNFKVSRTVYKDGSSKYFINGNDCEYEQMTELLKQKGIDLNHDRFLILQGEVEQISLMPPKAQKKDEVGLLEYLEDIIGTIKYIKEIDEIEKLQQDGQENRQSKMLDLFRTNDLLKKVQKQKDTAFKFLNIEREFYLLKNIVIQIEIREKSKEIQKLGDQLKTLKNKCQKQKEEKKKIKLNYQDVVKLELNIFESSLQEMTQNLKKEREDIMQILMPLQFQRQEKQTILRDRQSEIYIIESNQLKLESEYQREQREVLFKLLEAQKRGRLSGILGRLGDLGSIDKMYEVAITTSCGKLDHIVVLRFDQAEECMRYLRNNKIAKGKFMPLDQIKDITNSKEVVNYICPPKAKRLYDLIKVQNKDLRKAFYSALKDTLVTQNFDDAIEIAYQQNEIHNRVVTLQGQLIKQSGSMNGDGNPKQGGMSLNDQQACQYKEEDSIKIENEIEELNGQIREAKELKPQLQNDYNKLQSEIRQSDIQIETNMIYLDQLNLHKQDQERRLQQLKGQLEFVDLQQFMKIQDNQNQIQIFNDQLDELKYQID
ncbi:structural maintenance of chromosomes protein 4 [Stylonychia lemnae]|uniref:Structural maintenance of chromosomes protein 4 n=1 Tax=Stylonychia lemnae TaxID=5949 RepID=A0A078AUR6_STYLE|nr:structural maintenance of chromosomes protein 4 [Stylonychia lemnae]|eukprot:CDW85924.1 structural maintenance of chromosomes protein 4 [Stylonychia lemnae]